MRRRVMVGHTEDLFRTETLDSTFAILKRLAGWLLHDNKADQYKAVWDRLPLSVPHGHPRFYQIMYSSLYVQFSYLQFTIKITS